MALRRRPLLLGMLFLVIAPSVIYGCGPFFVSAIFAFVDRPDVPETDFAAGKLGIVRPGFRQAYLVSAYRYLTGLKLTPEQQKAALEVWARDAVPETANVEDELVNWSKARKKIPNLPPGPGFEVYAAVSKDDPYSKYLNCPAGAFQNAVKTLDERSARFGAASATMRDWVSAQDRVFANCEGDAHLIPAAVTSGDALARADRSYQIAAAHFYARDFDEAARQFDAIAKDSSSPWAGIGSYLAARALIRKANLVHKQTELFDPAPMAMAQQRLEKIVAGPRSSPIYEASVKLLNFVHFRTEPEKRVAELDRVLFSPSPSSNFKQDLWDYALLLSRRTYAGDPSDWLQTFHSLNPAPRGTSSRHADAAKHALARWHETKSAPWLVAALAAAKPGDADVQQLLAAADQIPRSSPAYLTVRYYALPLRAVEQPEVARKELDALLNSKPAYLPRASRNLLNEERLKVATNLEDFLQHAPETPVPSELDENTAEVVPASGAQITAEEPLFNHYAAEIFSRRLPLALLQQAAESPALPRALRREVARSTWLRSVLLHDWEMAAKVQAALHEVDLPLWRSMDGFRSAQSEPERTFAALLIILNNPGMKPVVRESSLRSATLGQIDEYRDNWWCTNVEASAYGNTYQGYNKDVNLKFVERDPDFPLPSWVAQPFRDAATSEWKRLSQIGTAPNYLTEEVLAYANAHPNDPRVPEGLHLAVRSTRFGCTNIETSRLSKAAFDLLHERYPQSEWTVKTKYHY